MTSWVEAVLALEPVARRAPSVLNTQPVVLRPGDERIDVHWASDRTLTALDPDGDQLWMSLGAFIEAVMIAAGDSGIGVRAEYPFDRERRRFAVLYPGALRRSRFTARELQDRVTGIGRFADPPPSLAEVGQLADAAGLPSGVVVVAWERATGYPLAERAHRWLFSAPGPRRELRFWVRPGADDGIEPVALGLPTWRAELFRTVPEALDDGTADLLGGHPRGIGTLAALVDAGAEQGPARTGVVGAGLLRLGLQGIRHGLRLQSLPQVTACPETREMLAALLEASDLRGRAVCVVRLGTPQLEPPLSRRRPTPIEAKPPPRVAQRPM